MFIKIYIILITILLASCSRGVEYVELHTWKYGSGNDSSLHDVINFSKTAPYHLNKDSTIFYSKYKIGKIISISTDYIKIRSNNGEFSVYVIFD